MIKAKQNIDCNQFSFSVFFIFFFMTGTIFAIISFFLHEFLNLSLKFLEINQESKNILYSFSQSTLIPYMKFISIILFLMSLIFFIVRYQERSFFYKISNSISTKEQSFSHDTTSVFGMSKYHLISWFLVCSILVLSHYWPTLFYGFFRGDDFDVISLNRTEHLFHAIFTPLGDNTIPIIRLEMALLKAVFGINPLPYNILLLFLFVSILFFAFLTMKEIEVNFIGIVISLTLFIGLTVWGQIITGFYHLSMHPQILLLCLIAIWAYIRWQKIRKPRLQVVAAISIILAPLVSIAGLWVPPAILVVAMCYSLANGFPLKWRTCVSKHAWLVGTAVVSLLLAGTYNLYVFARFAPDSMSSMANDAPHGLAHVLEQFFFIITGGILLQTVLPIGYWRLPVPILFPLLLFVLLLAVALGCVVWRRMEWRSRWYATSCVLIILGTCLMVVLKRGLDGFGHAWPPKYIGTPYLWYCILLGIAWTTIWKRMRHTYKPILLQVSVLLLILWIGIQYTFSVAASRLSQPIAGYGYGYRSYIQEAKQRKSSLNALKNDLIIPLLNQKEQNEIHIPTLDDRYLSRVYPRLPLYNLSQYRDFIVPLHQNIVFLRNSAMQRRFIAGDVRTVTNLRAATDPIFLHHLEHNPYVQTLYLQAVPLVFHHRPCANDGALQSPALQQISRVQEVTRIDTHTSELKSEGGLELVLREGAWAPEASPQVRIDMTAFPGTGNVVRLEFGFAGDLAVPYPAPWIELPGHEPQCIAVDLMQVYAYALNPHIHKLVLRFRTPGKYSVSYFIPQYSSASLP